MCLTIGHRGACGYFPDNTLPSVEKAIELEVDIVEVDVHISKDKKLVAIHDDHINGIKVSNFSARELKEKYNVPLIEEVFSIINNRVKILLDVKYPYDIDLMFELLSTKDRGNVLVTSTCNEIIKHLKTKYAECSYGIVEDDDEILCPDSEYNFVILRHKDISLQRVESFNNMGVKVFTYTVNNNEDIYRCKNECNVNGIVSDYPDRVINKVKYSTYK